MLKASPCTMLKTAFCTMLKTVSHIMLKTTPYTMLKLAPRTMQGIISYHRVLVDDDFVMSTSRYWPHKGTGRCRLHKGYW